jgi:hypothetical protein
LYGSEATLELEPALPLAVEAACGITAMDELLREDFFSSEGFHMSKSFGGQLVLEGRRESLNQGIRRRRTSAEIPFVMAIVQQSAIALSVVLLSYM